MAANDAGGPANLGGKIERRSPPAASQSKRDRKRQALMERLASMNERFQRDRDLTYRDQLQKVQFDTTLIQRFDPYDPDALDMLAKLQQELQTHQGQPVNHETSRNVLDMAGINFTNFMEDVEDLIAIRDFQLTQSKVGGDTQFAFCFQSSTLTN
jgi:hypothetical protein